MTRMSIGLRSLTPCCAGTTTHSCTMGIRPLSFFLIVTSVGGISCTIVHSNVRMHRHLLITGRSVGRLGTGVAPPGGLTKGLLLTHTQPYCTCPHKAPPPKWGKGAVAASSTLQRVLPREVTHVRPKSYIPFLRADDTWGRVPSHILINLRILGPRGWEPGQRPRPAGTPTWVGFH